MAFRRLRGDCRLSEPTKKYQQLYTINSANTVVEGHPLTILNLPPERLKQLALAQLQAGEAVWFGNDVLADMDRKSGTLKGGLFNYSDLFGVDFHVNKTDRIVTTEAEMSHAMTLTGADVVDGTVTKWKVENSWGKENGHDGYFLWPMPAGLTSTFMKSWFARIF